MKPSPAFVLFLHTHSHSSSHGGKWKQQPSSETAQTCEHVHEKRDKQHNDLSHLAGQMEHFSKSVGFISHIHLAKRPWKALVKGRPIQKLESDWTNLQSTTFKVDQSDLFTAS